MYRKEVEQMKVYVIYEECHDMICIAKDIKSAIKWLIDTSWITENTYVYCAGTDENGSEFRAANVAFGSEWKNYLIELADDEIMLNKELARMGFKIYSEEVIGG